MYIHVRLFLRQRFHGTDFTESGCRCGQEYLRSIYDRSYKAVEFYVGGPRVTHSNGLKKYSVSQDVGKTYNFKITVGDCNQSKERKPVTGFTVASGRGVKNRSNGGVEKRKKKNTKKTTEGIENAKQKRDGSVQQQMSNYVPRAVQGEPKRVRGQC